eukprot:gb/GECG01001870.1/.p1 GENE.gb/GECG01001870.1/~~gb/GECG01001870.1/.p1  ORF type:complete len:666 (+),score=86.23 gb/GECG01001870.1/:1-1998(+)
MENYTMKKVIGKGAFGKAVLAVDNRSNEKVVIKVVDVRDMPEAERRAAQKEVTILSKLSHPAIIGHIESFEDDGSLHIVTELAECGDLSAYIARKKGKLISEKRILSWVVQICLALLYVHKKKVLHRDLKTQNIFLTKNDGVKLGDFGIARVLKHTFECANTVVGTPYYLSPEICENKPYNHKSDIWAVGCIIYEMCAQRHAFEGASITSLIRRIMRGVFKPIPEVYSRELRSLLNLMLSKNPSHRPSVGAILQLPFLQPALEEYVLRCYSKGYRIPHVSLIEEETVKEPEKTAPSDKDHSSRVLSTPQEKGSAKPVAKSEKRRHGSTPEGAVYAGDYLTQPQAPPAKETEKGNAEYLEDTSAAVVGEKEEDRGMPDAEAMTRLGTQFEGTVKIASEELKEGNDIGQELPQPNMQRVLAREARNEDNGESDLRSQPERSGAASPRSKVMPSNKAATPGAEIKGQEVPIKANGGRRAPRRRRQKIAPESKPSSAKPARPTNDLPPHHPCRTPEKDPEWQPASAGSPYDYGKAPRGMDNPIPEKSRHHSSVTGTTHSDREDEEFADILPKVLPGDESTAEKESLECEITELREFLISQMSDEAFTRLRSATWYRRMKIARRGGQFDLTDFVLKKIPQEYDRLASRFIHLMRLEDTLHEMEEGEEELR